MLLVNNLGIQKDWNWYTVALRMDFKPMIAMGVVTIKALHWLLSNQKWNNLKMDQNHQIRKIYKKKKINKLEFKEYLEGTLISSRHQIMNSKQALGIHFYLLWEMIWTSLNLDAQIKIKKFIIVNISYIVLVVMISL